MNDVQLFFPPLTRRSDFPNLGTAQLTAYLRRRGVTAAQADLNASLLASRPPDREREPAADPLRLWHPPARPSGLWNSRGSLWDAAAACERARRPSPVYDELYEGRVRPAAEKARCVGFSLITTEQVLPALFFARRLKEDLPDRPVLFGGSWVSASWTALSGWPELFDFADLIVGFSGEAALESVARALRAGVRPGGVPNAAVRRGGRVVLPPIAPAPPLAELPCPEFDGLEPEASAAPAILPYQTTRGCEWGRCRFCYHVPSDNAYAAKPAALCAEHMTRLAAGSPRAFALADLSTPLDVMAALAAELSRRGSPATWEALTRSHPRLAPETARRLAAGGCRGLYFGFETASAESLRRLEKGISLEILDRNVEACAAAGLSCFLFILNYPGQTLMELEDTVAWGLERTRRHGAQLIVQRFELGRTTLGRLPFSAVPAEGADRDLESFDLPCRASGVSEERFRELLPRAREEASRLRRPC